MAGFSIVPFQGMLPRVAPRLLGPGAAVDATNVNLLSGEIRPIKRPKLINTPQVSGPWLAVYRAEHDGSSIWLAWDKDVDAVRAPLPPTIEPRFYWTGDGELRYAPFSDLPNSYAVGVPRPQTAPTVTPSGGSGNDVTRVYVYTFFSALGEESAESPASALTTGKDDGTWAISNMDAFPASSGTGTAAHSSGVTTFTNTGNHWLRAGDEVVIGGDTVTVAATPTASTFEVPGNYAAETAWSRVATWNTTGMKRRLYRSAGSTGSYQMVDDDVGTTYNDTLDDTAILGDELISASWALPPPGLKGLIALPNGSLAGFFGNQLCYSEPYQPHAWPVTYRRATDFEIVGIQSFGTTVVACTAGVPYVASGVEPANVTLDTVDQPWPCLSKRSVVSTGDGVMYATAYGLAYVGAAGSAMFTDAYFSRIEWTPLDPASMIGAVANGKVFMRYSGGRGGVMVLSPAEADAGLTRIITDDLPTELYSDERNGMLYFVDVEGIKLLDTDDGIRLKYSWRSKDYRFPTPLNLGAAKVDFAAEMSEDELDDERQDYDDQVQQNAALVSSYSGIGAVAGARIAFGMPIAGSNLRNLSQPDVASVTFTLYRYDEAVFSRRLVGDDHMFRLPAIPKGDVYSVELTGTVRVMAVHLAETMTGLKQL